MNILVITGSPKGEKSVTLQYARWLVNRFPDHQWTVAHGASRILGLEKDPARFEHLMDQVRAADLILWAFPLYVLLVHAGLRRLVELIHERGAAPAFAGKYAATLSTSIHFHDNCAHDYMQAISEDLGMRFAGSHSPAMDDLTKAKGRKQLEDFGLRMLDVVAKQRPVPRRFPPLAHEAWNYVPAPVNGPVDLGGKRAVILHDAAPGTNALAMVQRLADSWQGQVAVHDINQVDMRANCLGCMRCAMHSHCVQQDRDGYVAFYKENLFGADIVVLAGNLKDRHLSARWRRFFERGFFKTHIPTLKGKQVAFLISGPVAQNANLQEIFQGWVSWQESCLAGILGDDMMPGHAAAGDDAAKSRELDQLISGLARDLAQGALLGSTLPLGFHGQGGRLIFRDHIYGPLRFVFQADHRYYKRNGYYDFPTRNWRQRLLNILLTQLFKIPAARRAFELRIKDRMVAPHQQQVEAMRAGGDGGA